MTLQKLSIKRRDKRRIRAGKMMDSKGASKFRKDEGRRMGMKFGEPEPPVLNTSLVLRKAKQNYRKKIQAG